MNYLTLEHIDKSFGEKILFQDLSLTISKGQKIALIAKNGSGKTTLLKIIAGEEVPEGEHSRIIIHPNISIGYLPQEPVFNPNDSILDAALDSEAKEIQAIKKYEAAVQSGSEEQINATILDVDRLNAWDIESKLKEILGKLNLHDLTQKVGTLSGGQRKRLALVKIILENPDFVILDEPTNHLDIHMIEWLEKFLSNSQMALFMVTHDRYFLERVCNEIIELDDGQIFSYRGNYSSYLEKKDLRLQNDSTRLEKDKQLYKKELEWIRRQPKARSTKAKSRVDAFDKIKEDAHKTVQTPLSKIEFEPKRLGSKILELHHVSKSFDNLAIVKDFSYKFKRGEKIGIVGPNGVGKTSFIKLMTKELRPDTGKVVLGDTVEFGHYNQEGLQLQQDKTVIQVIRDVADYIPLKKGHKMTAEALLERFLFPRPQQQVFVSKLSGGERRRLLLLRTLIGNPNFLILDEPTNDLDVVTLNILEDYLVQFPGCVIVISHDRYFMDKIINHLFILEGEGKVKDYNGTYSSYKYEKATQTKSDDNVKKEPKKVDLKEASEERKLSYFEKKEYNELPNEIEKLEKEKKDIEGKFVEGNLSGEEISKLSQRLGEINKDIDDKESRWLELAEFM
jgi:ATP-binding cassette subfamily F protein uup